MEVDENQNDDESDKMSSPTNVIVLQTKGLSYTLQFLCPVSPIFRNRHASSFHY